VLVEVNGDRVRIGLRCPFKDARTGIEFEVCPRDTRADSVWTAIFEMNRSGETKSVFAIALVRVGEIFTVACRTNGGE